ncbi:MAG TPA: GAF domain-containing protein, partial [Coriobacteriia bacterium]
MATTRTGGRSLATQVTVFTAVAVTTAVLLIGFISLWGVYTTVLGEDTSRIQTYRQLLADGVDTRLNIVARAIEPVTTYDAIRARGKETPAAALSRAMVAHAEYFDAAVLAEPVGRVLATSSADAPATLEGRSWYARAVEPGTPQFAFEPGEAGQAGRLWVVHPVDGAPAPGMILAARVRTGFIDVLLDEVVTGEAQRAALIVDGAGAPVRVSTHNMPVDLRDVSYESSPGRTDGRAVAVQPDGDRYSGFYDQVGAAPELEWRVVVLEPERMTLGKARQALLPAAAATVVACALAVLFALAYGRRMVAPLSAFERRAREIASGGYVRPMTVQGEDEIGRLADAFNAMGVRLNSLQDMAQLLASASDLDEVLDSVLSATGHLLGTSDSAILLADEESGQLVLARGHGLEDPDPAFHIPFDEPSPVATAYAERRTVPIEGQGARWAHSVFRLFGAETDRSGIAVPLVVGDAALGVVVALAAGRHPLTEAQVETMRAFSAHAAAALRTSRLFEHERVSKAEAEALRQAAELVVSTPRMEEALERVAAVAAALLDMTGHLFAVDDRDEFGLAPAEDPDRERALLEVWRVAADESGERSSPFEPIVLAAPPPDAEAAGMGAGCGPVMLVPLVRGEDVRGVMALCGPRAAPEIGHREITAATALGREVSLALENAALLQEARSRAANLETIFRISQAVSSSLQVSVVR